MLATSEFVCTVAHEVVPTDEPRYVVSHKLAVCPFRIRDVGRFTIELM